MEKKIFFRKNVCFENPEGSEWLEVDYPRRTHASSISCSMSGVLWLSTYEGECFVRVGASRECLWGTKWIHVENSPLSIKQISVGTNAVWALSNDSSVHYRIGIQNENPTGTKWVSVPANGAVISTSCNDKVSYK